MENRLQQWNTLVLMVIVLYVIGLQRYAAENPDLGAPVATLIALLTSVGFYRIALLGLQALIKSSDLALRLYWGSLYLDGFWSYSYTLSDRRYIGVWRIQQDQFRTRIRGFGLNDSFARRSSVRSVTDLIPSEGAYEVVNLRTDLVAPDSEYYSKTTLFIDAGVRERWYHLRRPLRIRARTIIYGGVLSGTIHPDVEFVKHETAKTEDDVVRALQNQIGKRVVVK